MNFKIKMPVKWSQIFFSRESRQFYPAHAF